MDQTTHTLHDRSSNISAEHTENTQHDASRRSPENDYTVDSSSSSPASEALSIGSNESRPQSACESTKSSRSALGADMPDDSSHSAPAQPLNAVTGGKEKRKRSRVTAEQLTQLERIFASDRSPTAARRKEISDLLGMHERQTQIWFQNRRAKAKLQEEKMKGRGSLPEPPPDTPPELSPGFDADLYNLIHEDEPVSIIPCSDLAIGTWRRIASTLSKHDLVAYVCEAKQCLTWYINSSGFGFKMVIPFDIIIYTKFSNVAPGTGLATFTLSQPPQFYLENFMPSHNGEPPIRLWKRCADWTEGTQASQVLRHDLLGPAIQLAQFIQTLNPGSGSGVELRSPADRLELSSTAETVPSGLAVTVADEYRHDDHPRHVSLAHQLDSALRQRAYPPFASIPLENAMTARTSRTSSSGSYTLGPSRSDALATHSLMAPHTPPTSSPGYYQEIELLRTYAPRTLPVDYFRLPPTSRPSTQGSAISQGSDSCVGVSSGSASPLDYLSGRLTSMSASHSPYGTPSPSAHEAQYTQPGWGEGSKPHTPDGEGMFYRHAGPTPAGGLSSMGYHAPEAVPYFQGHVL